MATSLRNPGRPVLTAARARQGRYGRHVLWVLMASTALAALALFGAWTWRAPDMETTEQHNGKQAADAQPFDTGAPQTPTAPRLP